MRTTLARLQDWFRSECDGQWEHSRGVKIETLDNPGWSVTIDLAATYLEAEPFDEYKDQYEDEVAWLRCWAEQGQFHAACGPGVSKTP